MPMLLALNGEATLFSCIQQPITKPLPVPLYTVLLELMLQFIHPVKHAQAIPYSGKAGPANNTEQQTRYS